MDRLNNMLGALTVLYGTYIAVMLWISRRRRIRRKRRSALPSPSPSQPPAGP